MNAVEAGFRARQRETENREQSGVYCMRWIKLSPQSYQRHTHSHTDRHAQKYTHALTWLQMRLDKPPRSVWMRGTDSEGEVETHTQSSVEPGKISPVPNK